MSQDIKDVQGKKALTTKNIARYLPFSVDKKPLKQKVKINDDLGLVYKSYDPITDFDSKVLHILAKMCMDAKVNHQDEDMQEFIKLHDKFDETPFWGVSVWLHGFARYLDPQNKDRKAARKRIFESLDRLAGVAIKVYKGMEEYGEFEIQTGHIAWINGIALAGEDLANYDEVDLWVSAELLTTLAGPKKLAFNLESSMQYKGRPYFLYMFMQSYRYKITKNRYGYQNYVPHDEIISALNLQGAIPKRAKSEIKKAFSNIGLKYIYGTTKEGKEVWKRSKI